MPPLSGEKESKTLEEEIHLFYQDWLKRTKRNGSILTSHSLREWHFELAAFVRSKLKAETEEALSRGYDIAASLYSTWDESEDYYDKKKQQFLSRYNPNTNGSE